MPLQPWSFTAVNLPEHADNPIHTDAGAKAAGFDSALVAGVTTYAAMSRVPATAWGVDWVERGGAAIRFRQPVLDGDRVDCTPDDMNDVGADPDAGAAVDVRAAVDGEVRVEASFIRSHGTAGTAAQGERLQPIEFVLDRSWSDYGARAGDDCTLYAASEIAHPSSWPRIANRFCHDQLVTGSWIHVRSRIAHHGTAPVGSTIRATASVVKRWRSRIGERAVLDVQIAADGAPVATVEHEAIISLT